MMGGMPPRGTRMKWPLNQIRPTHDQVAVDFEIKRVLRALKAFDPYAIDRLRWWIGLKDAGVSDITTGEKMAAM